MGQRSSYIIISIPKQTIIPLLNTSDTRCYIIVILNSLTTDSYILDRYLASTYLCYITEVAIHHATSSNQGLQT